MIIHVIMKGETIAVVVAAVLVVGSGVYYYGFDNSTGTLNINITDPLPPGWSAVYVNISSVSIHNSTGGGNGVAKTFSTPVSVDLASATNTALFLTSLNLPEGHYQMIRLTITGAYGSYQTSSGMHTYQFKLVNGTVDVAGQFSIAHGATTTVVLDFNSAQAIHGNPNSGFIMTPVVDLAIE